MGTPALHPGSWVALTAAHHPAEGDGVVSGCSAQWRESCTLLRGLPVPPSVLAEVVCFGFCTATCCGGRSEAQSKSIPENEWQHFFFKKAFKKNCYQPLKQELHSPCVYSKDCSTIWKVCLPFSFQMQGSPFMPGSWERKPQKLPLLSVHSAQNTLWGNTCSCLRKKTAACSAVHSCSTKHMRLDHFASCPNATVGSPKMKEIRRLNNVE